MLHDSARGAHRRWNGVFDKQGGMTVAIVILLQKSCLPRSVSAQQNQCLNIQMYPSPAQSTNCNQLISASKSHYFQSFFTQHSVGSVRICKDGGNTPLQTLGYNLMLINCTLPFSEIKSNIEIGGK
jgi:hypothetical protein